MIENEKIEEMMMELEEKAENTVRALENDYGAIRTGRANPKILDKIEVEAYGGMSKLIELGNVSALDARCLQINLWDKSLLKAVEKAILQSNIGLTPSNDGNVIRLVFPVMTEERRKELAKQAKKMGEDAKVAIRNHRREAKQVRQRREILRNKRPIANHQRRRRAVRKLSLHSKAARRNQGKARSKARSVVTEVHLRFMLPKSRSLNLTCH